MPCWVGGGDPPASVGWLKDGSTLVGAQPRASLLENGTLRITSLRVSRSGAGAQGTHSRGGHPWGGTAGTGGAPGVGKGDGGCSGWWLKRVVGPKGDGCSGWWVLRVVGAHGGGCKGRWTPRVVDARGGGCKGWWARGVMVTRVGGCQGGGCEGWRVLRVMGQELFPSQVTDSGHYECVATSPAGETRWGGSLEVRGGSRGRHCAGDTVAPGTKPPQISTRLPAGDGSDLSLPSPEPGVLPGPPSTPVVTNVTKSSVTLSWKGNEDSGAADITSYVVEAFRYRTSVLSGCRGDAVAWCHPTMGHPCTLAARRRVVRGRRWRPTWRVRPTR